MQSNPRVYFHGTKAMDRRIHGQETSSMLIQGKAAVSIGGSFNGRLSSKMTQGRIEKEKGATLVVPEISWRTRPIDVPSMWHLLHTAKASMEERATLKFINSLCVQHACVPTSMHPSTHAHGPFPAFTVWRYAEGNAEVNRVQVKMLSMKKKTGQEKLQRSRQSVQPAQRSTEIAMGRRVGSQLAGVEWGWGVTRVL